MKARKYIIISLFVIFIIAIITSVILLIVKLSKDKDENGNENITAIVTIDPYAKYTGFEWLRNTKAGYDTDSFNIIDGKLYHVKDNAKILVESVTGTPKYINQIIRSGTISFIIVITEEGTVWINENIDDGIAITMEDKFVKLDISGTVLDMTEGNAGTEPYSGPYYLTKEAALLTGAGKTYEQINGQHINVIGNSKLIYINKDKTLSYNRTTGVEEYVLDRDGNKVVAKQVFIEDSSRWVKEPGLHYYIVTEDNKLLVFSSYSLMVAYDYEDALEKEVKSIEMISLNKIRINFTEGKSIDMTGVNSYYDMDTNKVVSFK